MYIYLDSNTERIFKSGQVTETAQTSIFGNLEVHSSFSGDNDGQGKEDISAQQKEGLFYHKQKKMQKNRGIGNGKL